MNHTHKTLKTAVIGCGAESQYHLGAWRDLGVAVVAVCDHDLRRARQAAQQWMIPHAYDRCESLVEAQGVDFVDLVVDSELRFEQAMALAHRGIDFICREPLCESVEEALALAGQVRAQGIAAMAHEHYRWQAPVRMFKSLLPKVGTPFFVRLSSRRHWSEAGRRRKELLPHALNEMGSHLLDCIRYLFGEVARIEWCRLHSPDHNAPGETGFTIALQTEGGATCIVDESSASYRATSGPKHVLIEVDGERGSLLLREGSTIEWTGPRDSWAMVVPVDKPSWSEERLAVINGGILAIQRHWLDCLHNRRLPETSVFDNLLSLELVFGARQAAATAKPFVPRREFRV